MKKMGLGLCFPSNIEDKKNGIRGMGFEWFEEEVREGDWVWGILIKIKEKEKRKEIKLRMFHLMFI